MDRRTSSVRCIESHLARAVAGVPAGRRAGIEHEYSVSRSGERIDFRSLIEAVGTVGRRLDPADRNAHRCAWGGVVTADGFEAEVATPPEYATSGFATALDRSASHGRGVLTSLFAEHRFDGYSTHISVESSDERVCQVGRRVARRDALALMLLMDNPASPGLLIRPRRGRVEICGDFVSGPQLTAATVYATAAVADAEARRWCRPAIAPHLAPSRNRYGWYVDRTAFGPDLHAAGRHSRLVGRGGRSVTAQRVLEQAWERLRTRAEAVAGADELQLVDRIVLGDDPLPGEARLPSADPTDLPLTTHGSLVADRRRGRYLLRVRAATWHGAAFDVSVDDAAPTASICVPHTLLAGFLDAVDAGALDDTLADIAEQPGPWPPLGNGELGRDELRVVASDRSAATALVLDERDPETGRIAGGGRGVGSGDREQKHRSDDRARPPRPTRSPLLITAAGAVVAAAAGVGVLALKSGDGPSDAGAERVITIDVEFTMATERLGEFEAPAGAVDPLPPLVGVGTTSAGRITVTGCTQDSARCILAFPDMGAMTLRGQPVESPESGYPMIADGTAYTYESERSSDCDAGMTWSSTDRLELRFADEADPDSVSGSLRHSSEPLFQQTEIGNDVHRCFGRDVEVTFRGSAAP